MKMMRRLKIKLNHQQQMKMQKRIIMKMKQMYRQILKLFPSQKKPITINRLTKKYNKTNFKTQMKLRKQIILFLVNRCTYLVNFLPASKQSLLTRPHCRNLNPKTFFNFPLTHFVILSMMTVESSSLTISNQQIFSKQYPQFHLTILKHKFYLLRDLYPDQLIACKYMLHMRLIITSSYSLFI